MTHPGLPALPPHLYRSECFAEDLAEADTPLRPVRSHRHFPFPIAAYPPSPMPYEPARQRPAAVLATTAALSRSLRLVWAWAAPAGGTGALAWGRSVVPFNKSADSYKLLSLGGNLDNNTPF